jgi:hypothetical protein
MPCIRWGRTAELPLGLYNGCGWWIRFPEAADRDELFTVNDLEATYLQERIGR